MKVSYIPVYGELKSADPKDVVKALYDFLFWQYKTALQDEISIRATKNAFIAANEATQKEYDKEDFGGGFGTPLPYSKEDIKYQEQKAIDAEVNTKAHKITLDFYVKKFME